MFLTPRGRNICVCVNHSHSEFNYCFAFAVPCVFPSRLKNRQHFAKQDPILANKPLGLQVGFQLLVLSVYTSFLFFYCQLAKTVPNKVHRRDGYDVPPLRVDLQGFVIHAQ